jgi:arsenate reductase
LKARYPAREAVVSSGPYADLFRVDMTSAMHGAALRLHDEFADAVGLETLERFLHDSFAHLEARATVNRFTPLIAERQAREALHAVAHTRVTAEQGTPAVLFVCRHDSGRSQIAQAFFRAIAGDRAFAFTGGSKPGAAVNPLAARAMHEVGLSIDDRVPQPLTPDLVRVSDVVVTMNGGDACLLLPGHQYEDWALPPQRLRDLDDARRMRDLVHERVLHLADELGLAA